ncbi:MAG: cation-translocating P-type ATPase [Verrucomicrobiales bacterium]|nr:cation-translocating P-type ATPase [Verrucomicrobiales bacterium]
METSPTINADTAKESTTTDFLVEGMTCQNCARHVTEAIQGSPGVRSASVSLERKSASVRWNPEAQKDIAAVIAAVQNAGYEAKAIQTGTGGHSTSKHAGWQINLWLGLAVTAALMIGEWIFGLAMTPWFQWLAFALAGVVQICCGAQFYRGAWRQLKVGSSNMDTLVALGSTTAFGFSCWVLFSGAGGHVYFMEAAAIISLISAGHWLESRVSEKAGGALKALLHLAPQTARRIQKPEARSQKPEIQPLNLKTLSFSQSAIRNPQSAIEAEVPVSALIIGDLIALRPGDRVPVDGVVMEGDSAVDEAMLTGESVPVDKKSGSELFAGTVNLNGRLVMRVAATGEATALAHIIAAVQRAQTSRADIQRLGDRISNVFVPVVVTIAVAAALWWGFAPESARHFHDWLAQFLWQAHLPMGAATAFIVAAAILIVACPCAMGLATPAAIMASANTAAKRGILIRDGVALEKAGNVTAVIFDKTGTLTMGKPEVADSWSSRSRREEALAPAGSNGNKLETPHVVSYEENAFAAALARNSTHPISQAIAKISAEKIEFSDWEEVRGSGVSATLPSSTFNLQPSTLRLGSLRWLKESDVDLAVGEKFIAEWSGQGATIVGLASDKTLLGLFAVRDAVKANAKQVVEQLQRQGLKIYLLTGDNSLTAASIAKQVGIAAENVFSEVRPEQKAEFVKKLQAAGERVAFVGDGINDAPALTQADLGIAVSRASDVAREAADIILLKSEIEAVPEALGLARATLRTIKQNLFWAFFYNALGVPLAAMGFISPIFCAAAMGVSDLVVIGNALRLLRWRQKDFN